MNVLQKCCYRSLKENRKRTAVTIVGIVLATSLITAVACMAASFRASMTQHARQETGDFHYLFSGVVRENLKYFQNNQNIERLGIEKKVGYALLTGCQNPDKPYLYIRALDDNCLEMFSLKLCEGRLPENETELLMSRHIRSNGGVDLKVGDVLTLPVGSRIADGNVLAQNTPYVEGQEYLDTEWVKTYTIVGMVERPSYQVEDREAPGYSVFTKIADMQVGEELDIYVSYTRRALKQPDRVTAGLLGISLEEYNRYEAGQSRLQGATAISVLKNHRLLRWENLQFSSTTMNMLYSMAAIAILLILVTSVFCIRNSFVISLTEKMRLYGRLASVGTTSRQQRKIVYYEAMLLGLAGIPLGVLCGVFATFLLTRIVGGMMEGSFGFSLRFSFSLWAVFLGVILSMATVFFSAYGSARRAAMVSPLSAIRANDMIRKQSYRCPRWVGRIFGIGGKIAYKSLRRARVRYRTTVVSIVVSVAIFIAVSGFIQLGFLAGNVYQENTPYPLAIIIEDEDWREKAGRIAALDGIQEIEVRRTVLMTVDRDSIPFTQEYRERFVGWEDEEGDQIVLVNSLGDAGYADYLKRAGIKQEEAADKAILVNRFEEEYVLGGKKYVTTGKITDYQAGDRIVDKESGIGLEILALSPELPMYMGKGSYNNVMLIVSDAWMDAQKSLSRFDNVVLYIQCENAAAIEETVHRDMGLLRYAVSNYETQYQSERNTLIVVAVFLYGFIVVVSLIGITNIFNTVTTNMELRAPEFAVLKSVGMTGRQFKRMIWLEGLFYGGKALLIGIPLGLLLSYWFHIAMGTGIVVDYQPPVWAVLVATAAVFLLLAGIMQYSMGKVKRRNLIETIQNENI